MEYGVGGVWVGSVRVGSVRVAPTPASVGVVRSVLRRDLAVLPESAREDVALVASELLGNAMRHGSALADGRLAVAWGVGEMGVEISVTDGGGPTLPRASEPAPTDIGGRGLSIVASVAARWGVERRGFETTVWAVVPVRMPKLARA
jgi:anti-sigma regulatory factor (Ser/Thr protein kinase)